MAEIPTTISSTSEVLFTLTTPTSAPVPTTLTSETTATTATTDLPASSATSATTSTTPTSDSSSTALEPSSSASGTSSQSPTATPSSPSTQSASPAQLSAGSIAGIAVGSIVGLVLIAALLLFAFGFRVRHRGRVGTTGGGDEDDQGATAAPRSPGSQPRKAELEDGEYARRLERLHDGAKPELEGGWLRRAGWKRAFSVKSARSQPQPAPAELATEPLTPGPYELPDGNAGSVRDC